MAGMTYTEKVGFLKGVLEFMEKNAEALKSAGFDTAVRLADQEAKNEAVTEINEEQESLKRRLQTQTEKLNDAIRLAYVTASGNLDAMSGMLGKDSVTAKNLAKFRSRVRLGARTAAPTGSGKTA